MAWTLLALAGLFEVVWAIGLKYTEGFTRLVPSVLSQKFVDKIARCWRGCHRLTSTMRRAW
ncbi:SMR family transporter, partial [Cupriavidus sp. CP313]